MYRLRRCRCSTTVQVRRLSKPSRADPCRARRWKASAVLGSLTTTALLVLGAACSRNAADPHNARLNAIRADPAFTLAPPGARLVREFAKEARRAPLSNTYLGPRASRVYQLSGGLTEALQFYTERLPSFGWEFWKAVPLPSGEDVLFTKNFESWKAKLTLDITNGQQELTVLIEAPPAKSTAGAS